ncbi:MULTISPECIES: hypothetical protein [Halorussus]|uniref:hypothetical protein n=1 Tax=Halorussus TaxID=1070314 RepID=UPI0020A0BA9B|nr:hypothetical protein [Halorussus vallis]USZ77582.1 hypothetical protein NGM07_09650 [Halorussus vallis]
MSGEWPKEFDLNMEEELLEAWEASDGIRELIANALDESALSNTEEPEIFEDKQGRWHIRDYGRGLTHQDLTQGEDEEKLNNPDKVIGKFGVGLKDALAVLYRQDVDVTVHSPYISFSVEQASKAGFDDVETLHAVIRKTEHPDLDGTEVILDGCTKQDIEEAKQNFLTYTDAKLLEKTRFGEIYEPATDEAQIYVTGLKVATEQDFLFSYNITNTMKKIRDALNRERSNVGRTAYTSRVKRILQDCESGDVAERLVDDLEKVQEGTNHDELSWKPVQVHAAKVLNARDEAMFVTAEEQGQLKDLVDRARGDGKRIVTVPDSTRRELHSTSDIEGGEIRDVDVFQDEWQDSFEFEWVDETDLTEQEAQVWELKDKVLSLVQLEDKIDEVRISETMRSLDSGWKAQGLWEPQERRIVVKRNVLDSKPGFVGLLLHEAAHAKRGASDQTREFEGDLTDLLGITATAAIEAQPASDEEDMSPVSDLD